MIFKVTNLNFNYKDKELYNNLSFQLNQQEHAIIVGVNGCGKTTLLDIITKNLKPDSGTIEWENGVTFSYLDQHYKVKDDFTVEEYIYSVYSDLLKKEKEMNDLYLKGSDIDNPKWEKCLEQAQAISEELDRAGFYSIKEEVNSVLTGLGIPLEFLDRKLSILSSGQREKVYLGKMLLENSDVLILDEPTNYLDAPHVEWLINYLNNFKKAFLIVSHDEAFCARIANVVFSMENKVIERYKGDFKYFKEQSVVRKEQYTKNYEAQQRYIKKEEEFIAKNIVRATSSKAAKSRRQRLSHLEVLEVPKTDVIKISFSFPYSGDIGKEILHVKDLVIGYEKPLLKPISFDLFKNEKIAIIGKNGIGKSTLIKTLLKITPKLGGSFAFNDRIKINYFSQTEMDDLSITPLEFLRLSFPTRIDSDLRSVLGRSGVKSNLAIRPLSQLSGGEEAKTRLALLTQIKSTILILDEPTNHLDVHAKSELKKAIKEFPGNVILVSHEKSFYADFVDKIIELK